MKRDNQREETSGANSVVVSEALKRAAQRAGVQPTTSQSQLAEDVAESPALCAAFQHEMNAAISRRLDRDTDYMPDKYPNTKKFFKSEWKCCHVKWLHDCMLHLCTESAQCALLSSVLQNRSRWLQWLCLYFCTICPKVLFLIFLQGYTWCPSWSDAKLKIHIQYAHTQFIDPFSGTNWVSRYQEDKTNLDFTEARDCEWLRYQLGHMQVCTAPLSFLQAGCLSCCPTNRVKASKAKLEHN